MTKRYATKIKRRGSPILITIPRTPFTIAPRSEALQAELVAALCPHLTIEALDCAITS